MIRYITLKNYRCFTDFSIDFTCKNDTPVKLAIIYGANGSGKSSLLHSFGTLCDSMQTMSIQNIVLKFLEDNPDLSGNPRLNSFVSTAQIIQNNKSINSCGNMSIEIGFQIEGRNGVYFIEYDNSGIAKEKLEFTLEKNKGIYYSIDDLEIKINESVFGSFKKDLMEYITRFRRKHSVLAVIYNLLDSYNEQYWKTNLSGHLVNVLYYFHRFGIRYTDSHILRGIADSSDILSPDKLTSGTLEHSREHLLDTTATALNTYFTSMYPDIVSVFYAKRYSTNDIDYTLYFRKKISGATCDIPFYKESRGTEYLIYLLPYFVAAKEKRVVAIDEIDNGIHDVLMTQIMQSINTSIAGQLIITTHNTMLLNEYAFKDSFYFIDVDNNGHRSVVTPSQSDYKIQKDSNVAANYLKGKFKGLPWNDMDLDFANITL